MIHPAAITMVVGLSIFIGGVGWALAAYKTRVREALEKAIKELEDASELLGTEGYFNQARQINETIHWLREAQARASKADNADHTTSGE